MMPPMIPTTIAAPLAFELPVPMFLVLLPLAWVAGGMIAVALAALLERRNAACRPVAAPRRPSSVVSVARIAA